MHCPPDVHALQHNDSQDKAMHRWGGDFTPNKREASGNPRTLLTQRALFSRCLQKLLHLDCHRVTLCCEEHFDCVHEISPAADRFRIWVFARGLASVGWQSVTRTAGISARQQNLTGVHDL